MTLYSRLLSRVAQAYAEALADASQQNLQYVGLSGSVRHETAGKESDIDLWVVVNDKEKLKPEERDILEVDLGLNGKWETPHLYDMNDLRRFTDPMHYRTWMYWRSGKHSRWYKKHPGIKGIRELVDFDGHDDLYLDFHFHLLVDLLLSKPLYSTHGFELFKDKFIYILKNDSVTEQVFNRTKSSIEGHYKESPNISLLFNQ